MASGSSESSDVDDEMDPRRELKLFVRSIETPGTFAYGASLHAPAPNLTVQGLGSIPLPLSKESVSVLRGAAELAPFGHGAETKVDESVRRAWQIDGERIGLSSEFVEAIGRQHALKAAKKLGLRAQALGVEARLYKLVMYESGGHFRPHKDTEKEVGMFGTLVVQLPTAQGHEGGALIVRHRSMSKVFAWQDPDGSFGRGSSSGDGAAESAPSSLPVRCAAFYGDCEHELQPVTAGVRLCLLYNLVRTTPGPSPVAAVGQSGSAAQLRLSDAMAAWGRPGGGRGCDADKFILPLEHEYTKASLSFGGLKGRDRAMADALRARREVDLYLATVVKHETGAPEPEYGYGGGWSKRRKNGWYDEEDEEDAGERGMEEVFETQVSVKNWIAASDDKPVALRLNKLDAQSEVLDCIEEDEGYYQPDEEEAMELLFPSEAEPDKREYEGYMGNYGPTLEFWYHRAVLVLWPASATTRMVLSSGVDVALDVARQRSARYGGADALALADLASLVSLAERTPAGHELAKDADKAEAVLGLCAASGAAGLGSSRRFLRLLAGGVSAAVGAPGLQSEGAARGAAALVCSVGWPAVGNDVTQLVEACDLEHVAVLARELSSVPLQQQHGASSSAVAAIASACTSATGIKADLDALKQATAEGSAGIVRLLQVGLPSCTNPQLLAFAGAGSPRLPTAVLAAAVHEFRIRLELSVASSSAGGQSPQHSAAVVTLATTLAGRSFRGLNAAAVRTFAEDVLWLAARANGAGGLEQGFAGAVLTEARSGSPAQAREGQMQLKAVLKSKAVQAAVRGYGGGGNGGAAFWRTMASERLGKVQTLQPPALSWRQPNAILGEHPQVQAFLRGPEREMNYTRSGSFSDLRHAQNFSNKYFAPWFSGPRHFSARCDPRSRGHSVYVRITKSREGHERNVKAYEEDKAEAAILRALLRGGNGGNGGGGGGGSGSGGNRRAVAAAAAAAAAARARASAPLSSVSGNVGGASSAATPAVGSGKAGERQREEVEVVDLCDSP